LSKLSVIVRMRGLAEKKVHFSQQGRNLATT
jgi:hypothetical protein